MRSYCAQFQKLSDRSLSWMSFQLGNDGVLVSALDSHELQDDLGDLVVVGRAADGAREHGVRKAQEGIQACHGYLEEEASGWEAHA